MNNGKVAVLQAAPRYGGLPTELGWKIFLGRYTVKDPDRAFQPGDLALLPVVEDAKWGQKEIGQVVEVRGETDTLVARIMTGPDEGGRVSPHRLRPTAGDQPGRWPSGSSGRSRRSSWTTSAASGGRHNSPG